jgi:hypothetical protein
MMKQLYTLVILSALFLGTFKLTAQDVTIASADFSTCNSTFNDTNPIGPYGPNEDETITICAESPEIIVNIFWITFNLGSGDTLRIYDGNSTASPLMGVYTGADLLNTNSTSTNPDGCLTLHWTSDATNEGDFGAVIYCGVPCNKPVGAVNPVGDTGNPLKVCVGEQVTLSAAASQFFPNTSYQSVTWNFGDTQETTNTWPEASHTYSTAGAYQIQMFVTDNTGCASINNVNFTIWVSTTPTFNLTHTPDPICLGSEVNLAGRVTPTTYSPTPTVDLGGAVYIPDNQGCFYDTVYISGFAPGQVMTDTLDLASFYVNMEHSFLTDYSVSLICPNGSTVAVHQQGGVGVTYVGIPVDDESGTPGTGWDYWFSPSVSYPNWAQASSDPNYTISVTDPVLGNTGNSIISGTYGSESPWDALIGCPLNGPWIIRVCDVVAVDDGWIFGWGVSFNPSLYPDNLSFTPFFDSTCTYTYWAGQGLQGNDGGLCDSLVAIPNASGQIVYTYTAVDDFGCTYTADEIVNVIPRPIANAGPDLGFCGSPIQLNGVNDTIVPGQNYNYEWTPSDLLSNSTITNPNLNDLPQDTTFYFSVTWVNDTTCRSIDSVRVFLPANPVADPDSTILLCSGEYLEVSAAANVPQTVYQWYWSRDPLYNVTDSLISTSTFLRIDSGGYYIVRIIDPFCGDVAQTVFTINETFCEVIVPNIFSPDGNGVNDKLTFDGLLFFPGSDLKVYNRWGGLVYESASYQNTWSPAEDEVADGTYYFILGINRQSGKKYVQGPLNIVRKR